MPPTNNSECDVAASVSEWIFVRWVHSLTLAATRLKPISQMCFASWNAVSDFEQPRRVE